MQEQPAGLAHCLLTVMQLQLQRAVVHCTLHIHTGCSIYVHTVCTCSTSGRYLHTMYVLQCSAAGKAGQVARQARHASLHFLEEAPALL